MRHRENLLDQRWTGAIVYTRALTGDQPKHNRKRTPRLCQLRSKRLSAALFASFCRSTAASLCSSASVFASCCSGAAAFDACAGAARFSAGQQLEIQDEGLIALIVGAAADRLDRRDEAAIEARLHLYVWGRATYHDLFQGSQQHYFDFCQRIEASGATPNGVALRFTQFGLSNGSDEDRQPSDERD